MKKNLSNQTMDAVLQDFLGNKPSMGTPSLELQLADTQEHQEMDNKVVQEQAGEAMPYAASAASNAGHRWRNTRRPSSPFRPSKTASPCSSAAAHAMPSTA